MADAADLKSACREAVRVRVPFSAPFADVENWHIIRTQNAAFVGSTPTIGTICPLNSVGQSSGLGCVAQLAEHLTFNQGVSGSNPDTPTNKPQVPGSSPGGRTTSLPLLREGFLFVNSNWRQTNLTYTLLDTYPLLWYTYYSK